MLTPLGHGRQPRSRAMRGSEGALLLDRFRLEREREVTDAGVLHDAVESATGRRVSIEIANGIEEPQERVRFVRDALAAQRFDGDHVLRVLDTGTLPDGTPFVVREHAVTSLAKEIEAKGPLASEQAAAWTLDIAEAVAEAHALGMAHGDIGPQTVFLVRGDDGALHVKLSWATASKAHRHAALASARREAVAADIDGLGRVLRALVTGEPSTDDEALGSDGAKTLPNGIAHVVARATTRGSGGYENLGELARDLAPFAPEGHPAARNVAFMLWHAGIGQEPKTGRIETPTPMATVVTTPTRPAIAEAARTGPYDGDPVQPVPWMAEDARVVDDEVVYVERRHRTWPSALLALLIGALVLGGAYLLHDPTALSGTRLGAVGGVAPLADEPFDGAPETRALADRVTTDDVWFFGSVLPPHGANAERERGTTTTIEEEGTEEAEPPARAPRSAPADQGGGPSPLGAPDSPAPFDLGGIDI